MTMKTLAKEIQIGDCIKDKNAIVKSVHLSGGWAIIKLYYIDTDYTADIKVRAKREYEIIPKEIIEK